MKLVEKPKNPPPQPPPPAPVQNGKDDDMNGSTGSNADDDESWQVNKFVTFQLLMSNFAFTHTNILIAEWNNAMYSQTKYFLDKSGFKSLKGRWPHSLSRQFNYFQWLNCGYTNGYNKVLVCVSVLGLIRSQHAKEMISYKNNFPFESFLILIMKTTQILMF